MRVALALLFVFSLASNVASADAPRFVLNIDARCDCATTTRTSFDTLFGRSFEDVLRDRDATLSITIAHGENGSPEGERWSGSTSLAMDGRTAERRIDAGSCREITEALTLLVAIAIEPSLHFVPATDAEVARPPVEAPLVPVRPAPREMPSPREPARFSAYVAASAEFATLPTTSPLFVLGGTVRFANHLALSLDVGTGVPIRAQANVVAGESIAFRARFSAAIRACYHVAVSERFELATCGGYRHLVANAEGDGFGSNFGTTLNTPSILAGASLTWKPLALFSFRLGIDSLFHLTTHSLEARDALFGERVTLHTTASAGLSPTFAIEITP